MLRVGLGRDLHRLGPGRPLILGGVEIPFEKGELGHSDGDALSHAILDALLGAAGLGDIGEFFPPGGPRWKDARSLEFLKTGLEKIREAGWELVNLDCVVSLERPKLLPWRQKIRESLSAALEAPLEAVFLKAKTGEGLPPVGTGDAVEALALCLLEH